MNMPSSISYTRLEHKADVGFLVKAPSLARLYADCALSLTDMLVKLSTIDEKEQRAVSLQADDGPALMVKWLNEILYLFEQHKFLCRRIIFKEFDGKRIDATLWGEKYLPSKHGLVSEIKAVTYHQLELGESSEGKPHCYARIFLDL